MPHNFSKTVHYDKRPMLVVVVPHQRKDGLYYEININGFPRFFMTWSALGRYDIIGDEAKTLPYNIVLAVSDMLEKETCK
ncbi:MAG: hypothetical protein JST52_05605 [Bacteroidetes bacterium]|nr:hypothetical protein [Bacteroidota bacterium]MBS1741123.1 hypothetical protein [Bacteroidota bacterium]